MLTGLESKSGGGQELVREIWVLMFWWCLFPPLNSGTGRLAGHGQLGCCYYMRTWNSSKSNRQGVVRIGKDCPSSRLSIHAKSVTPCKSRNLYCSVFHRH